LRAYGRPAETINQYMRKGRSILIEGRLQFHQWQGQDGAKRSKHMVVVDTFQFLDSAPRGEGGGNAPRRPEAVAGGGIEAPPPPSDDEVPPMRAESDIPF
jgi:single-strand DNA-binding protein